MYRACAATMALTLLLPACLARADTVWLKDGSIVKGEILEVNDDHLKIDTDFANEISIDLGDIDSLRSTHEMTITFSDESERTGYLRKLPDGSVYLSQTPPPDPASDAATAAVPAGVPSAEALPGNDDVEPDDLLDLSSIHKMEQKKAYFWYKSNFALGVSGASGNTETANANISGAIRPRFGKNLIDIDGQANYQDSEGETTASNWRTQLMYTRELTMKWGATGFVSFENDEKQDLSLRTAIGAGASRLIRDTSKTHLDVFLGLAYVKEGFELPDGGDPLLFESSSTYGAIRWQANYTQDIVSDDYQFYHNHRLTHGVISETQFLALTTTGLNIEFIGDLDIQLELQFDYNSDPTGGTKNEDLRYLVKLKYDFEGDQNDWFK